MLEYLIYQGKYFREFTTESTDGKITKNQNQYCGFL